MANESVKSLMVMGCREAGSGVDVSGQLKTVCHSKGILFLEISHESYFAPTVTRGDIGL